MTAQVLATLTPDRAVLLLTCGVLLIYLEMNRPGWVLTGAVGLLASLIAIASLLQYRLSPAAVVLVATATALLLLDLFRRTPPIVSVAATLALVLGLAHLVQSVQLRVHSSVAVVCGLVLGAGTSFLTKIARRARTNKGLD